jgi:hypothetical protein
MWSTDDVLLNNGGVIENVIESRIQHETILEEDPLIPDLLLRPTVCESCRDNTI